VQWVGEEFDDRGSIFIQDNRVEAAKMVALPPEWYTPPGEERNPASTEDRIRQYREFLLEQGIPCDDDAIISPVIEFVMSADHRFHAWRLQRA